MWGPPRARARSPDSPRSPFQERSLRVGALQRARPQPEELRELGEQEERNKGRERGWQVERGLESTAAKEAAAARAARRARAPGDAAALGQRAHETGHQVGASAQVGATDTVGLRRIPRRLPKQLEENPVLQEWLNTSGR
jgi:hypothetical protein